MKRIIALSSFAAVLLCTAPVYAMQASADKIESIQKYSENAKVVFSPGEKFDISSDKASKENDISVFSGNVVVKFKQTTLRSDSVTMKKQADGTTLLEANSFTLEKKH